MMVLDDAPAIRSLGRGSAFQITVAVATAFFLTFAAAAGEPPAGAFPSQWHEVAFRPSEYLGVITVIEIADGTLRINRVPVSEQRLLAAVRAQKSLIPEPALYIRATPSTYASLRALAETLAADGTCSRPCLYTVVGRTYPAERHRAVP